MSSLLTLSNLQHWPVPRWGRPSVRPRTLGSPVSMARERERERERG
ncbi:unnamed protein product [Protopolystoma xenopodis]|uniref:Uncharacterized protein n=1 Tax=Protopolystoma xenopodis TaxID=117903 RepID=A0A3S5ANW2_9PLAT|nr:unnamed protein product [Protopolystoma xenopodis]